MIVNDAADLVIITIERMNDVIRKQVFGEGGESTYVREQNREEFFFACGFDTGRAHLLFDKREILLVEHQPPYRDRTTDARLASEPHMHIELQMRGNRMLSLRSRRAIFDAFENDYAAGRTTRISATGVRVRNTSANAGAEQRLTRDGIN